MKKKLAMLLAVVMLLGALGPMTLTASSAFLGRPILSRTSISHTGANARVIDSGIRTVNAFGTPAYPILTGGVGIDLIIPITGALMHLADPALSHFTIHLENAVFDYHPGTNENGEIIPDRAISGHTGPNFNTNVLAGSDQATNTDARRGAYRVVTTRSTVGADPVWTELSGTNASGFGDRIPRPMMTNDLVIDQGRAGLGRVSDLLGDWLEEETTPGSNQAKDITGAQLGAFF